VARFNKDAQDSDVEHSSDDELDKSASDEMRLPWNYNSRSTESRRWSWCTIV